MRKNEGKFLRKHKQRRFLDAVVEQLPCVALSRQLTVEDGFSAPQEAAVGGDSNELARVFQALHRS